MSDKYWVGVRSKLPNVYGEEWDWRLWLVNVGSLAVRKGQEVLGQLF